MPRAAEWSGTPKIKGSTEAMQMALLTFSLVGLQFTWGIEMTYCTPYLLQLGLTKSKTSMVWIAGPLSGLIMQPLVGVIADNSRSKWGRRRPFMVGGSIVVALCLFVLGWTSEIVGWFIKDEKAKPNWTIALAVASIYAVDFAINAVQSSCRSLIVDTLPIAKQQTGSAWASRMVAIGHLVGYGAGSLDLPRMLGTWMGETQFKQLIIIAAFSIVFAMGLTSWAVTERVLISSREESGSGAFHTVAKIFKATLHLPDRIQAICWVQFWAWIGWFPFLFYCPTWVGETYFRYTPSASLGTPSSDRLGAIGRVGSLSLVIFSLVTFASSVLLPMAIRSPEDSKHPFTPRPPPALSKILTAWHDHKPDLLTGWLVSHFIFSLAMLMAPLVRSLQFATTIVGMSGIPWALASWAPFAFMGVEINRLTTPNALVPNASTTGPGGSYHRLSISTAHPTGDTELEDLQYSPPSSPRVLRLNHSSLLSQSSGADVDEDVASTGETAGIYLGILNLYTTLPQFVGTFISMIVFAIFEPGKSPELAGGEGAGEKDLPDGGAGVNAIGICLFIGGLSSLGAAYATTRLRKKLQ